MEKMQYEAPVLTQVGSLEEITKATNFGIHADHTIPAGGVIVGNLS